MTGLLVVTICGVLFARWVRGSTQRLEPEARRRTVAELDPRVRGLIEHHVHAGSRGSAVRLLQRAARLSLREARLMVEHWDDPE